MAITPTNLRKNLFKILDELLESGETLEVNRNGQIIKIVPQPKGNKLDRLVDHKDALVDSNDDIISTDWEKQWKPFI